jgi:hypothetical protein
MISVFVIAARAGAAEHSPSLDNAAQGLDPGKHIGVILMLDNRIHMDDIYPVVRYMKMDARREYVIRSLKERYQMMGEQVERYLQGERKAGNVSLLRPLWIMNSIRVRMAPELIAQIDKSFPEVFYILNDAAYENTLDDVGWGLDSLNVPEVWRDFGANGAGVLLGHKDSGCTHTLPAFDGHIWINPGEDLNSNGHIDGDEANGIDDDGNDYIDDFYGWNFEEDNNNVLDGDPGCHGTLTSSVISSVLADRNSCDTVAVAPGAKLVILKSYEYQGAVFESSQYAIEMGVQVISQSVSFKQSFCDRYRDCPNYVCHRMVSEVELAAGIIHANSTGNEGLSNAVPLSVAAPANSPPPAMTPGHEQQGGVSSIVAVSAYSVGNIYYSQSGHGPSGWSREDICAHSRAPFCGPAGTPSAYPEEYEDYPYHGSVFPGLAKPDVTAPSWAAAFTCSGNCGSIGATSGATPHVGAVLALIYSAFPGITPEDAYLYLISGVQDADPAGWDSLWGFGMVRPYPSIQQGFGQRGTVTGNILAPNDEPLAGVNVWSEADVAGRVYTDENGEYFINLPAGEQSLRFHKYGFNDVPRAALVVAGDTIDISHSMTAAAAANVTFHLVGIDGEPQPLANMPVTIPEAGQEGFTNENGDVQFAMLAGELEVHAAGLPWVETVLTAHIGAGNQQITINTTRSPQSYRTGPDLFGYYMYDMVDAPDLVQYDWVEINPADGGLPGTTLNVGADGNAAVTLPFTFRFYGTDFTQVRVHANGFIIFGTEASSEFGPYPIPATPVPNNFMAPFFQDWQPSGIGRVLYFNDTDNHRAIFEWFDVQDYLQSGIARFQCILLDPAFYPTQSGNGQAIYQYHTLEGRYEGAIGIENSEGTDGIEYYFQLHVDEHGAPLEEELALLISTDTITDADERPEMLPEQFILHPNFPNPFNPSTTFSWTAPRAAHVQLSLFNILGREAAIVYKGMSETGLQSVSFDASGLPTGIYFARLEVAGTVAGLQKVMLLK